MDSNRLVIFLSGAAISLLMIKLKMDNDNQNDGGNESISPYKYIGGNPTFAKMNGPPENLLLWPQPLQSIGPFHNQEPNWISSTAGFPAVPVRPSMWRRSSWNELRDPITTNGLYPVSECFTHLIDVGPNHQNGLRCSKDGSCASGLPVQSRQPLAPSPVGAQVQRT